MYLYSTPLLFSDTTVIKAHATAGAAPLHYRIQLSFFFFIFINQN
jgi:hypothetical protein